MIDDATHLSASEITDLLQKNLPSVDHRNEVIISVNANSLSMRLPVVKDYLSKDLPAGSGQIVLSGPIMLGFADTAMYACVHASYGSEVLAVIVNFNVSFFRLAGDADLLAKARIVRKGRSIAFLEAHLFSGGSLEACAQVTATYSIKYLNK
jgi:acyl-coenzyme A thioesterase PaaI-like protein